MNNYEYIREYEHVIVICGITLFSTLSGSRSMSSPFMHNLLYVTVTVALATEFPQPIKSAFLNDF